MKIIMNIPIQNFQLPLVDKDVLPGLLHQGKPFIFRIVQLDLSGKRIQSRPRPEKEFGVKVILKILKMSRVIQVPNPIELFLDCHSQAP